MSDSFDVKRYEEYLPKEYPVRHREKEYLNPSVRISQEYRRKIDDIKKMDAELDLMILRSDDYIKLVSDAHASNVHWSTSAEGNPVSLKDVRKFSYLVMTSDNIIKEKNPGPEQEILNHLYSYFTDNSYELPWDLDTIKSTHRILMKDTGIKCRPGTFSDVQMYVKDEENGITFIGCPPDRIEAELQNLIDWVNTSPMSSIVTATVFFHEFESIHSFMDRNGGIGRTLFHILLQELGFRNSKLCMMDEKLLMDKSIYYALMEYTDDVEDYTVLTEYFIDALHSSYSEALERFTEKDVLKNSDELTKKLIVNAKRKNDWFTLSESLKWIDDKGEQTIRHKLDRLVDVGIIEKSGQTKGLRYRFTDPFREIRLKMNDRT